MSCLSLRTLFGCAVRNSIRSEISQCVQKCWSHSGTHVICRQNILPQSGSSTLCRGSSCIRSDNHGLLSNFRVVRSFKSQRRLQVKEQSRQDGRASLLFKPFCFTVAVCGLSFTGATIWQYECIRAHAHQILKGMGKARDQVVGYIPQKNFGFRSQINSMWNRLSSGEKIVTGLIAFNGLILMLWKLPTMHPFLIKYFSCHPNSSVVSMVLSAFSHISFIHFACNMYVLWSFSTVALNLLGKEQLAALYISGAAVSSMASLTNKILRRSVVTSLGASGALLAVIGAVCYNFPQSRLSIAFVGDLFPHSFSAKSAITSLVVFDLAGLVFGWKIFDHAAHLGGVLFGIWYMKYGKDLIWGRRETVMAWWHKVRGP
ncbi:presenilins-associated rhomboid-like protein, mitochondrial isoform X1 [Gigantopelta aegis]|uniref:presenilins-associated rhomboid-like protein, mitochondrial isoform X1 n=1 Tax=Gigantopelta aegis TaxID=1735272 RepID=UPI001B88E67F|nr:presenilins-associated rhomboid-like protein, mitochondrial isoform X1 [Gigantopelta aegis]